MINYEEVRLTLPIIELKKVKTAAKTKTVKTLKITEKNFRSDELPHELLLTTKQKAADNIFIDIKLIFKKTHI